MSDEKNTKPLSMRRIKALKALCKKATLAPWEDKREPSLTEDGEELRRYYHIESKKGTICELFYNEDWEAMGCYNNDAVDAAFIAAARQAVPDLLAEVERLRVENQHGVDILRNYRHFGIYKDERIILLDFFYQLVEGSGIFHRNRKIPLKQTIYRVDIQ